METKQIVCTGCSSRMRIPASVPPGKSVRCPTCSAVNVVPGTAPAPRPALAVASSAAAGEADMRECPFCSEPIRATAVKCRHCNEFVQEDAAPKKKKKKAAASAELNPAEYFVAIFLAPVGMVIGGAWASQGLKKGAEMLKISVLACVIAGAGWLIYARWNSKDHLAGLPAAPEVSDAVVQEQRLRERLEEERRRSGGGDVDEDGIPQQPRGRSMEVKPPDPEELKKASPPLQRALRATVCLETSGGLGSGVIVQRDGGDALILTNRHVVDNIFALSHGRSSTPSDKELKPTVRFVTGETRQGKVIWQAGHALDLALVRASCPSGTDVAPWNVDAEVHIGDRTFAVGNPVGLGWTTTFGQVSAFRDNDFGGFSAAVVQTDARIGPGNSGGGLYTQDGELIGINTYVVSSSRGASGETGLGFAIRTGVLNELKPDGLDMKKAKKKGKSSGKSG